jgi:hypothetical protein
MDQFQTVEREKTISSAIVSAGRYLDRYPSRSVSLMLSNTLVVSGIKRLERSANQVTAIVTTNKYPLSGSKALTVSFHDITAVSEDEADLVTDETVAERAKDILFFVQTKYDEGYSTPLFQTVRDEMERDLSRMGQTLADMTDQMKASFNASVRARVLDAASDRILRAYRPYRDFADMREQALSDIGLHEFIAPQPKTDRAIKDAMGLGKVR